MPDARAYAAGTRAALAMLSKGHCYNPECPSRQPIIKFIDGAPYIDYEIAHIRGALEGGPRYDPDMTDDERRAFANLMLLCSPCHKLVDQVRPQDFPIETLYEWKGSREADDGAPLAALGCVDETTLAELLLEAVKTALGNQELVVSEVGGVVTVGGPGRLPRLLPLEPIAVPPAAGAPPSELVRARSGVVPFSDYRALRGDLLDWCLDGVAFSARLLGGGPGAGKTRLAVQLCEDLARFGWVRGVLVEGDVPTEVEALVGTPTARLVVVDYAETRALQLKLLLPRLASLATPERPVRVLLLVRAARGEDWKAPLRGGGDWLDRLVNDLPEPDVLGPDSFPPVVRRELFHEATTAFARRENSSGNAVPEPPEDLVEPRYDTPLMVVVRAYLEVHGYGGRLRSRHDVLEELVHHEDRYWAATDGAPADVMLRRRVVAFATLAGASSEDDAAERVRLVPDLVDATHERRRSLARWANDIYPGRYSWWNPVDPDIVAEHLVATTYRAHPGVLRGVLYGPAEIVARPIALYARVIPDHAELATELGLVLGEELARLCGLAVDQAANLTDRQLMLGQTTVAATLARWVTLSDVDVDVLQESVDLMPRRADLVLSPLALVLTARLVEAYRGLAAANPAAHEPQFATSLNNLSNRLGEAGRHDAGLAASQEAVEICLRLTQDNPAAYAPDLAAAIHNLSIHLAETGRREEGLAASTKAVEIRRLMVTVNAVHEPDLAASLTNASSRLAEAGRPDEGLAASQEAVEIYRRLVATNAGAYEPALAASLYNLAIHLAEAGRPDEGLAASQEAVEIYRRLVATNPAGFTPELAGSLNSLSMRLAWAGRPDEGLAASQEAVEIYRRLVATNAGGAYEPALAASLNSLWAGLAGAGRLLEALAAIEEAVRIQRRLTAASPVAYESDLALSLNNLSIQLDQSDRPDEGLAASQEAVEIYRRLTAANPAAYGHTLVTLLINMSNRLAQAGRRDEAERVRSEARQVARRVDVRRGRSLPVSLLSRRPKPLGGD